MRFSIASTRGKFVLQSAPWADRVVIEITHGGMGLAPMVSIDRNEPRAHSDFNVVRAYLGELGQHERFFRRHIQSGLRALQNDSYGTAERVGMLRRAGLRAQNFHLPDDFNAAPERDIVPDRLGGILGFGIEPSGVGVDLFAYFHVIVAGYALPRASRVGVAGSEILRVDRIRREVMIAFDHNGFIGLRDNVVSQVAFMNRPFDLTDFNHRHSEILRTYRGNALGTNYESSAAPAACRWPTTHP